jgi:hypothetical protein
VSKKFRSETGFGKLKFNYGVCWIWGLDAAWHDHFHGARQHNPSMFNATTRNNFPSFLHCRTSLFVIVELRFIACPVNNPDCPVYNSFLT